ncbi:unnamed protein product [Discula destructiva]
MTASSRGSKALVPLLRGAPMCHRCAFLSLSIPARRYSSTSTTTTTTNTDPNAPSPNIMPVTTGVSAPPAESTNATDTTQNPFLHPKSLYRLRAGIILSRPPILTRAPTAFENAFYLYQKRLNERISSPFARTFYFRKGQPAHVDFALKFEDRRHTMSREVGRLTRIGRDAWDDEALIDNGAEYASPDYVRERLYTEAESRVSEDGEPLSFADRLQIERPLPRETEADRTGDVRRLDRALSRTLYLVVKDQRGRWHFPTDDVRPDEGLHETAARALAGTAGVNMNTWMVGRHPIAHEKHEPRYTDDKTTEGGRALKARGANNFYLKGRIMAGQADIAGNEFGVTDFKWLTKDELKEQLQPVLYSSVELSMPSQ